ncbi:Lrp/AsnC family transcriptional regulator [Candidatus Woesearchaeota archaeon]|nr:Lrp/AsnC family transcriptional regulator [Candidatus Woesearchaeota archaeon]
MAKKRKHLRKTDLAVIACLRENGRMPLTVMHKRTHIPISTLHDTIKRLEKRGMVRHVSLLNFPNINHPFIVHYLLSAKENLKRYLLFNPSVNTISVINKGTHFYVECAFRSIRDKTKFRNKVTSYKLKKVQEIPVAEIIKREGFRIKKNDKKTDHRWEKK